MVKKKKKIKKTTKSVKTATRKGKRGGSVAGRGPRRCGICVARGIKGAKSMGHNSRSHDPGSKLSLR